MKRKIFVSAILTVALSAAVGAENYAVLITGDTPDLQAAGHKNWGGDVYNPPTRNFDEFWHDTFLVWEMLWQYGWKDENIFVLFGNGEDWPSINSYWRYEASQYEELWGIQHITDDSAYYQDVVDVFNYLDEAMTKDDFLFVWTFDHGWIDSIQTSPPQFQHTLILMDREISDNEFAALMPTDYFRRVFWMQQCYSGGFIPELESDSTVILTATTDCDWALPAPNQDDHPDGGDRYENERIAGYEYVHGEFDYHVLNAARMITVGYFNLLDSADTDQDGFTSMEEIWNWEDLKDYYQYQQYSDPGEIGDEIFLNIPPYTPSGFSGERIGNTIRLEWEPNREWDLECYSVYKRTYEDSTQVYSDWYLLDQTTDTCYTDSSFAPTFQGSDTAWFKIAAMDEAGQLSAFSETRCVPGVISPQGEGLGLLPLASNDLLLLKNYPDPFNATTTISYALPQSALVRLSVYDIAGRKVAVLTETWQTAGFHQVAFNASDLPSGVYLYRLEAGGQNLSGKMLLMK
jgi:hypothetical protein